MNKLPEGDYKNSAFGVDWRTATPADIAGADLKARTEDGKTPFDLMEENKHLNGSGICQRLRDVQDD